MAGEPVLIAAFSGRALAEAARRSGFSPYVADLFGDEDMAGASAASRRVAGNLEQGFNGAALLSAVEELADEAARSTRFQSESIETRKVDLFYDSRAAFRVRMDAGCSSPLKLAYGAGFERAPDLLAALAERWPVLGNGPDVARAVKDPFAFHEACVSLAIPSPETSRAPVYDGRKWLAKSAGGAGGGHIIPMETAQRSEGVYYQAEIEGRAISALFTGAGAAEPELIGYSEQWVSPTPQRPFRYGGAAQPAMMADGQGAAMWEAVSKLSRHLRLRGLNSADFLVNGGECLLLEINPRPGATLDIFDDDGTQLFARHAGAVSRASEAVSTGGSRAAAVVYADRGALIAPIVAAPPEWIKDRPFPGDKVFANQPLCTVLANGASLSEAKTVCAARGSAALELYYGKP